MTLAAATTFVGVSSNPNATALKAKTLNDAFAAVIASVTVSLAAYDADPTGQVDATDAWNAAVAAIPVGGRGTILLPAGVLLAAQPWVCNGRAVIVRGEGTIIFVTHAGTGLSFAPGDLRRRVGLTGFDVLAAGPISSDRAIAITYPRPANENLAANPPVLGSWLRPTVKILGVDIGSAEMTDGSGGASGISFLHGIDLDGLWDSEIDRVSYVGPYTIPPVAGSTAIRIANSINVHVGRLKAYFADVAVDVTAYSEGLFLMEPAAVACNIGVRVGAAGTSRRAGASVLSLTVNQAELAVFTAAIQATDLVTGFVSEGRMSPQSLSAPPAKMLDLTNVTGLVTHLNTYNGTAAATGTAIALAGTSTLCRFENETVLNLGTGVSMAAGTTGNVARGLRFNNGATNTDAGTANLIEVVSTAPRPVVTVPLQAGTGTLTAATATLRARKVGRRVEAGVQVVITTNGSAAGSLIVTMPYAAKALVVLPGSGSAAAGKAVKGTMQAGSSLLVITGYDGSYPGADGLVLQLDGAFETDD